MLTPDLITAQTTSWIEQIVIGLELCPFASVPFQQNRIRYVVSEAEDPDTLTEDLARELKLLKDMPEAEIETTLLIHPYVFADFLDYNDYLEVSDRVLEALEIEGIIQVASFHPQYQFAGTKIEDIENYTNRSPYPMLHLLREASVSKAVELYPNIEEVPERNIITMKDLGFDALENRLQIVQAESRDSESQVD